MGYQQYQTWCETHSSMVERKSDVTA